MIKKWCLFYVWLFRYLTIKFGELKSKEISINVIIKGSSAAKYNILKTMLSASFPDLEDEEIDKYIIRAGVERELEKFSNIIQ